jgi:hypothetical protein
VYRRNPNLRLPWQQAVLRTAEGTPFLAPEVQLLFKSKDPRPKDDVDGEVVIPALGVPARAFLDEWLPRDHAWRRWLD